MRRMLLIALLLVALPGLGDAQGIQYQGPGGGFVTIIRATPNTTTGTTGEEVLYAVVIPAGTWNADGVVVKFEAVYSTAANANAKVSRLRNAAGTGGTVIGGVSNNQSARPQYISMECVRAGTAIACWGAAAPTTTLQIEAALISGLDFNTALPFSLNGLTAAGAGEMTLLSVVISVKRP